MKKKINNMAAFFTSHNAVFRRKSAKKVPLFNSEQLDISWKVTDNAFEGKRQYVSVFTLKNTGKQALPKSGWSLYFNYIRDIDPNSISSNIAIEHVNGDIFKLSPKANFAGLEAGKTLDISFLSSEIFVNIADAPFGLYWVNEQKPEEGKTIQKYKVIAPTEDKVGYLTSAQLYEKNALIHQLNANDLPPIFPTPSFIKKLMEILS
jgi:hexosaminidase